MSAESKKKQGEKTRARVKNALRTKPKTPATIAERLGLKESTVVRHARALVRSGEAMTERVSRTIGFKLPASSAPAEPTVTA